MYAGSAIVDSTANVAVWHAVQGLFNGALSNNTVDSATTLGSPGADDTGTSIGIYVDLGGDDTFVAELGYWSSNISVNNTLMYANQKAYWSGIP